MFNPSLLEHLLRKSYTVPYVDSLVAVNNALYAILDEDTSAGGDRVVVPVQYGDLPTNSADLATSQSLADAGTIKGVKFEIDVKPYYVLARIPGKTVRASRSNKEAFWNALSTSIDRAMKRYGNIQAFYAYGNGYGSLGASTFTGATITFTNPESTYPIEVGNKLCCSASESGAVLRNSGATVTVLSVNRKTGVVVCTGNVTTGIAAAVSGDIFFFSGDRENSATPARLVTTGLSAWIPRTAPSAAESFNLVDRSVDSRLYGNVISGVLGDVREKIIDAVTEIDAQGGTATHVILPTRKFGTLLKDLEATKTRYERTTTSARNAVVSFPGIEFDTQFGTLTVLSDRNCDPNDGWVIDKDSWKRHSMGKTPDFINAEAGKTLFVYNADALEIRVGGYSDMSCAAPSHNARITWDV